MVQQIERLNDNAVSVVIATYYRHENLKDVLILFQQQSHIPEEIIIVDQTPEEDRPPNFYTNFDLNIKLINLDKPSRNLARNIGAREAKNPLLLMIDDDIVFKKYAQNSVVCSFCLLFISLSRTNNNGPIGCPPKTR